MHSLLSLVWGYLECYTNIYYFLPCILLTSGSQWVLGEEGTPRHRVSQCSSGH